jgi:hypothetical protein
MSCDPRSRCVPSFKLSLPQESSTQILPFSALTNNMDYHPTSIGAGPSSYHYADFHALAYPHGIVPLKEASSYPMDEQHNAISNPVPPSSLSTLDFAGMFDLEFFDNYHTDFFHCDTPSSASSSEVMTPISSSEETEFVAIASGSGVGADVAMDVHLDGPAPYGHHTAGIPIDFSDSLLMLSKTTSDGVPVDWPQLLATMCDEHPDAVRWFAEMGGFQSDSDQIQMAAPQNECDSSMQFSSIYPHQHSDTLSDIMSSLSNSSSISNAVSGLTSQSSSPMNSSTGPIPLHHPRPVRPIPQIPLRDLAAIALRLGKPRGPRGPPQNLSSFPLLCQPVGDSVRYQHHSLSAGDANIGC